MKILIPGGHLTPALGLIDWVQEYHPETEFVFAGRVFSQTKLKQKAIEYDEVIKRGVKFLAFESVRSSESFFFTLFVGIKLALCVLKATMLIVKNKPSVVMSFGGYLALPIVIAAKILHVPILAHEGTSVLGKANRLIFKLADQLAYSYHSLAELDLGKYDKPTIITGTPLRKEIINYNKIYQPIWFPSHQNNLEILLVLGGNQGSSAINELIKSSLGKLTDDWIVVHQCGRTNKINNYRQDLLNHAANLKITKGRYFVFEWIGEKDLVWLYRNATAAVSRAGANTIEEMIYHCVPTIFIPLPFSHYQEQLKNAASLEKMSAGIVLEQAEVSTVSLLNSLSDLLINRQTIIQNLSQIARQKPKNPPEQLYLLLEKLAQ